MVSFRQNESSFQEWILAFVILLLSSDCLEICFQSVQNHWCYFIRPTFAGYS